MKIGGFQKLSLIDYPGKIAAIIFTTGCNFKCPFCYNCELVEGKAKEIPLNFIFSYLKQRKKFLDAVVITGGEPTIHSDLVNFCKKLKKLGFLIKLDTNGSRPEMIKKLIKQKLVAYIAMDIKSAFNQEDYNKAAGIKIPIKKIAQSVDVVKNAKDYEFRTTCVPTLINKQKLKEIAQYLENKKANKRFVLQQFSSKKTLDKRFEQIKPYSEQQLKIFQKELKNYFLEILVRS